MQARWITLLVLAAVGLGLVAGRVTAGGHEDKGGGGGFFPTPGAEHKELAQNVGDWDALLTFNVPGMGEMSSNDAESGKMIMKGLFLESEFSGKIMGQVPWNGRGITGYDIHTKEYVQVWFSEMNTSISVHRGTKDDKGVINLHGETWNKIENKMVPSVYMLHPAAEDGSHKMEMHWTDADKKPTSKLMQIVYKKKAK